MAANSHVLLVDDEEQRRQNLAAVFSFLGVSHEVSSFVDWFQTSQSNPCTLAFIGKSALPVSLDKLVSRFRDQMPAVPLCLLDGWDEAELLSAAANAQILSVLEEPLSERVLAELLSQAERFGASHRALEEPSFPLLVGESAAMKHLKLVMGRVVERDASVLITGESGTGKELVARSLHELSPRNGEPFVPVNCGAIPPELLESELFGHEKGAFTGAVSARAGRFEMANNGTLFLDEIGDMPMAMQVKLLRVLQERCFERVGGSKTVHVDVRVIAATHKNLEQMIAEGKFREDLFYRLNVYPIETPPLREREGDVARLTDYLANQAQQVGLGQLILSGPARMALDQYDWPGNVRELANLVERLAIMHPDEEVNLLDLPDKYRAGLDLGDFPMSSSVVAESPTAEQPYLSRNDLMLPEDGIDLKAQLESIEQDYIRAALQRTNQVVARAAKLLGVRRTTLVEKMKKYGIQRGDDE
ncbi:sigma-54 dependent transcriptional regulator [Neptunomonas marina]|uniref:Sigma-54-dependent Fis family transcriptional regulator n=1 Tax=Neptunomonas marina TaxID=1815562 RepID=A0A437Q6V6_9GAMM|nr:sigma-54 dependent transcriptional regulator [Neptunomonas marina]RVU30255.1 sigma-54-dependent Fis family transcriptional regulator [Neptunomonas marina]